MLTFSPAYASIALDFVIFWAGTFFAGTAPVMAALLVLGAHVGASASTIPWDLDGLHYWPPWVRFAWHLVLERITTEDTF